MSSMHRNKNNPHKHTPAMGMQTRKFCWNYAVRFNVSSCRLTNSILLFTNFPTGPCTYSLTGNTFNKNHIYHNYINCSASMLTVRHEAHNNRYNSLSRNHQVTT